MPSRIATIGYGSERPVPHRRLGAIKFDVVNRFSKTRRISRALAVAHPRAPGAYASPPASICLGAKTALVRCQVAQGPRLRAGFPARGGGGGVGMVWGSASARFLYVRLAASSTRDFLLSHTMKDGLHRTPPLSTRNSVPHSACYVIMTYHAAVICMIRPNRLSACRSCGPLKRQNPARPALLLLAMILG